MKRKDSDTHDPSTDGLSATQVGQLRSREQRKDRETLADWGGSVSPDVHFEAALIVIAHPENRRLGLRYTLAPGATLDIGRSPSAQVSLPEVPSLSRSHARLSYTAGKVSIEDLGSRNGTYVNDRLVEEVAELHSGDRFQVGSVHFKFLHERDVEHAYHEAIYQMVIRDGLTEIFNQRKFQEEGERELARALRHERPLTLVLFDIDHFKRINDTYGHLCGDAVLKHLAERVESLVRPEQIFARVGGEEFAILCPETDAEGARALAGKIQNLLGKRTFDCSSTPVKVTCSFGVATAEARMERLSDLVKAADQALYRAKNEGRNRIEVEPPGVSG